MKLDQEILQHKSTIAKFNADKKNILVSKEEAGKAQKMGEGGYGGGDE